MKDVMWSSDNILVVNAASSKKGGGVNAILSLLQEMIVFQDKVGTAIDAQDLSENKQKLEEFHNRLGEMYESLLDMARGGVQSIRRNPEMEEESQIELSNNSQIQQLP